MTLARPGAGRSGRALRGFLALAVGLPGGLAPGCKEAAGEHESNAASAYSGSAGRLLVYNPVSAHAGDTGADTAGAVDTGDTAADSGDTAGDSGDTAAAEPPAELSLAIDATTWTWTLPGGAVQAVEWSTADGLVVDDSRLLPATVKDGASANGVEVTDTGERAVWYGTFPDVASVTVSAGSLAGDWAFARDVGPIAARVAGDDWELVYYQ